MTAPRLLLVGDSHLARLGNAVPQLGPRVTNCAVSGAFTSDLVGQVEGVDLHLYDVVVISIGTNDAAPWKQVPASRVALLLADFVAAVPCPVVLVAPPGVDEGRLVRSKDRTNVQVSRHAAAASMVVLAADGCVVPTPEVLKPLEAGAFLSDGVHLSPAAYALLLPALADGIRHRLSDAELPSA